MPSRAVTAVQATFVGADTLRQAPCLGSQTAVYALQVGHGEFVTEWPAQFSHTMSAADASASSSEGSSSKAGSSSDQQQQQSAWVHALPAYCRDLATVVMGKTPVNFVHKSKVASNSSRVSRKHSSSNGHASSGLPLQQQQQMGMQSTSGVDGVPVASRTGVPTEWN